MENEKKKYLLFMDDENYDKNLRKNPSMFKTNGSVRPK